jgi:hypothetical protein
MFDKLKLMIIQLKYSQVSNHDQLDLKTVRCFIEINKKMNKEKILQSLACPRNIYFLRKKANSGQQVSGHIF